MRIVEKRHLQEFFAGASQHFAKRVIDAKQPAVSVCFGDANGRGLIGCCQTLLALALRALGFMKVRDIGGEAARVDEFPIVKAAVRSDQYMLDRAILGPQPRRITIKLFSAREPVQDIANNWRVRVELRDMPSDILFCRIAEQGELCLVCPQDNAFAADNVKTYRAVLEEIVEVRGLVSKDFIFSVPCARKCPESS